MNIVVTGATSFLGAAVIRKLLQMGHQVFAVVRPGSKNRGALPEGAGLFVVELELERLDKITSFVSEPCQLFLHFGWDGSGSENRIRRDVQQKNVTDSMKALEGARALGCRRFLFSGSQAEYGICREAMEESMTCHPVSEYGKAKVEFYQQAHRQCGRWKTEGLAEMEYIHARIFSVYGPGDHPWSLVNTCLSTFLSGGHMELGACTQLWNFLYIEDLAEGLLSLAFCRHPLAEDGIYNIAGAETATMVLREYVEAIYGLCGSNGGFTYGKLAPNAEGPANLIPDIKKIEAATGWHPVTTFEEGIRHMLEIEKTERKQQQEQLLHKENVRRHCLVCGEELPGEPLMVFDQMPSSAQDIPDANQVKTDAGITLRLHQCGHCGLVQFDCQPVAYYRDVIRSGGFSTTMVELRRGQYRHLVETYHLEGKKFIEVGCGRGEFLSVLTEFPVEAYGVEHKKDLVELAKSQGLSVFYGFTETQDTLLGNQGPYDVFLSFNFLEHQPEPGVMLDCIYRNLTEEGMGLITVPSLEYILQYDGYYELIRDHIAYYSFETLRFLLEQHGFQVLEEEMVNRDTCAVIVRKKAREDKRNPIFLPVDLTGMSESRMTINRELELLTNKAEAEGKTIAIWGASHQGFTLAATTCLGRHAQYIIDSAPFKQGRFAPASHLPVVAPDYYLEHPADIIVIVAPGYTREIAESIRSRFGAGVEIMTLRSDHLEKYDSPAAEQGERGEEPL